MPEYSFREYANALRTALSEYAYPTVTYDFAIERELAHESMKDVEERIRKQLKSRNMAAVKDGLSNVLYWGYATSPGIQRTRVKRFRDGVTLEQLDEFTDLLIGSDSPSFDDVIRLHFPEFSKMSFVSKLLMFLSPNQRPVLDLKLARFVKSVGFSPLEPLKVDKTTIRLSNQNIECYYAWAEWCIGTASMVNSEIGPSCQDIRAVDVERAIFCRVDQGDQSDAARLLRGPV